MPRCSRWAGEHGFPLSPTAVRNKGMLLGQACAGTPRPVIAASTIAAAQVAASAAPTRAGAATCPLVQEGRQPRPRSCGMLRTSRCAATFRSRLPPLLRGQGLRRARFCRRGGSPDHGAANRRGHSSTSQPSGRGCRPSCKEPRGLPKKKPPRHGQRGGFVFREARQLRQKLYVADSDSRLPASLKLPVSTSPVGLVDWMCAWLTKMCA